MHNSVVMARSERSRDCIVCLKPLDAGTALTVRKTGTTTRSSYAVCNAHTCHMVFHQDLHLTDEHFDHSLKQRIEMVRRRQKRALVRKEHEQRLQSECDEVFAVLSATLSKGGAPDLELVLPNGHGRLSVLPKRRKKIYAEWLDALIQEAFASPLQSRPVPTAAAAATTPASNDQTKGLAGRLCGACGGGCCVAGGNHAYLSTDTLNRLRASNPRIDPSALREAYLGRLPERTITGSCINHTRDGCALPKAFRSNVCNTFACGSLSRLQAAAQSDGPPIRKLAVLRRRWPLWDQLDDKLDNRLIEALVIDETETVRLRLPTSARAPGSSKSR